MNSITKTTPENLLEEIKAALVEYEFQSRWLLVEGYHKVGKIITTNKVSDLTQVAEYVGKSKRTIQRCVQFYKKYPFLELLPEGKNTSWNQIVIKYLSDKPQKEERKSYIECPMCKYKWEK